MHHNELKLPLAIITIETTPHSNEMDLLGCMHDLKVQT